MALRSAEQAGLARRGNEILRHPEGSLASPKDFGGPKCVLFVHGLTADSSYLSRLMSQFTDHGFRALAFNYECFNGIDTAAKSLVELLQDMDDLGDGAIRKDRLTLVCHSMGGLVGRTLVSVFGGDAYVRKLITLGTPHGGTLTETKFLQILLSWGESLTGLTQGGFSMSCRSALQLMGRDPGHFLQALNAAGPPATPVEFHSVSGGQRYIELGRNGILNLALNEWLQGMFADQDNDGLVMEVSSNLAGLEFASCAPEARHVRNYANWPRTNHSALIADQRVALLTIKAAKS